jgi:hypothetical protein
MFKFLTRHTCPPLEGVGGGRSQYISGIIIHRKFLTRHPCPPLEGVGGGRGQYISGIIIHRRFLTRHPCPPLEGVGGGRGQVLSLNLFKLWNKLKNPISGITIRI